MTKPVALAVTTPGELAANRKHDQPPSSLDLTLTPEASISSVYAVAVSFQVDGADPIFRAEAGRSPLSDVRLGGFGDGAGPQRAKGSVMIFWSAQEIGAGPDAPIRVTIDRIRANVPPGVTRIGVALYDFDDDIQLIGDDPLAGETAIAQGEATVNITSEGYHLGELSVETPVVLENRLADARISWTFAGPEGCSAHIRLYPDGQEPLSTVALIHPRAPEDETSALGLASGGATMRELLSEVSTMASFSATWVRVEMVVSPPAGDDSREELREETAFLYVETDVWTRLPMEFLGCPAALFSIPDSKQENAPGGATTSAARTSKLWGVFLPRDATGPARIFSSETTGARWGASRMTVPVDAAMKSSVLLRHRNTGASPHIWFVGGDQLSGAGRGSTTAHAIDLSGRGTFSDVRFSGATPGPIWGHRLVEFGDDEFLMIGGIDAGGNKSEVIWRLKADPEALTLDAAPVGRTRDIDDDAPPYAPGVGFGAAMIELGDEKDPQRALFVLGGAQQLTGQGDVAQSLWRGVIMTDAVGTMSIDWDPTPYFALATGDETIIAADISVFDKRRRTLSVLATVLDVKTGRETNRREIIRADVKGHGRLLMVETPPAFGAGLGWRSIRQPHLLRSAVLETGGGAPAVLTWVLLDDPAYLGAAARCTKAHRIRRANLLPELNRFA